MLLRALPYHRYCSVVFAWSTSRGPMHRADRLTFGFAMSKLGLRSSSSSEWASSAPTVAAPTRWPARLRLAAGTAFGAHSPDTFMRGRRWRCVGGVDGGRPKRLFTVFPLSPGRSFQGRGSHRYPSEYFLFCFFVLVRVLLGVIGAVIYELL